MRKFDFILLGLIISIGVWCLNLQLASPLKKDFSKSELIPSEKEKNSVEKRLEQLEKTVKNLQDENKTTDQPSENPLKTIEPHKPSEKTLPPASSDATITLSEKELERFINTRIEKYLKEREKQSLEEVKGMVEEMTKYQEETLNDWIKDAAKALNLTEQDEEILKKILLERNKKVEEKLSQEKKPFLLFNDKVMKEADEEMFKEVERIYGTGVSEPFKKYYRENPPPVIFSSGKGNSIGIRMIRPPLEKNPPEEEKPLNK
ncbi:MAG: hypothetical protein N2234_09085 [Planctomycetota bacterium]|nr:hypothetical protein [Planctomycetota bacterium]